MTLSTWWQLLDLYEIVLVWPLALVTLYLAVTARTRRGRIIGFVWLAVWLVPFAHRGLGTLYFDYLCKHEAGEFIYRTVDDVEGILQMRPRDGSKDYFDRMAMGDIPEDPWGHTNVEAQEPWVMLGRYKYIETLNLSATDRIARSELYHSSMKAQASANDKVARFFGYDGKSIGSMQKEFDSVPRSRYGFTWLERSTFIGRTFNVFPGEVLLKDLSNDETLAVMRGFYRVRRVGICPAGKDDFFVQKFAERVMRPAGVRGMP